MIHSEILPSGLTHTWSDTYRIRQIDTGTVYDDAVDILPHEYEETDVPKADETEATLDDALSGLREFGVEV